MSSLTVTAALCLTMRCMYVYVCINVFPDSNGSIVSNYQVHVCLYVTNVFPDSKGSVVSDYEVYICLYVYKCLP